MKTLYGLPGACSLASHIILQEIGATFEYRTVDLMTKTLADGSDYRLINPKGQVPAMLLDDGTVLTEGPAICQYLADLAPAAAMLPAVGDLQRYRVLEWMNFVATELHKTVSPLMRPGISEEFRSAQLAQLKAKFAIVNAALEKQPALTKAGFSIADAYLFVVASWMPRLGLTSAEFPNLEAFMKRAGARPAVQAALERESAA